MDGRGFAYSKVLIGIGAIGVVLAGLFYLFIDPYMSRSLQFKIQDAVSASHVPDELSSAVYLLTPANGGGQYKDGQLLYTEYVEDGSLVTDMARVGTTEAKVLYRPAEDVYELTVNGEAVFSSPALMRQIFVSPSGKYVSVAVLERGKVAEGAEPWNVKVFNTTEGSVVDLPGFAAPFYDESTVLVPRPKGLYAINFMSGEEKELVAGPIYAAYPSVAISSDSSKLAWSTISGEAQVYDLIRQENGTLFAMSIASIEGVSGPVVLAADNMYELAPHNQGTDLIRHGIYTGDTEHIRSFPSILALAKLIP